MIRKFLVFDGTRKFIAFFQVINRPEREGKYLPLIMAEVKNALGYISTVSYLSMTSYLVTRKILPKPLKRKKNYRKSLILRERQDIFASTKL